MDDAVTGWTYRFAVLDDAPVRLRERSRPSSRLDLQSPRVSVFCTGRLQLTPEGEFEGQHNDEPWLFGSFEPIYGHLEQAGELQWGFSERYPTGDGWALRLGKTVSTDLAADRVLARDHDAVPPSDLRNNLSFRCLTCGESRRWRRENPRLQAAVSSFAVLGRREVPLVLLDAQIKSL